MERRRWNGEEDEERSSRVRSPRDEREHPERDRPVRGEGHFGERYPERAVLGRGYEERGYEGHREGDWRDTEPYYARREDPDDRRYRGGRSSHWEERGGYPLGGYPHGLHWHTPPEYEERHRSMVPRRWPEGVHAPWEDPEWWAPRAEPHAHHERHAEHEDRLDHRIAEGIRRFFRGDAAPRPHAGKGPKGYRRSDERIREDVCDRIAHMGWVDASDVEVRVSEAEVTLTGTVRDRRDKRLLEDMIEHVSGVRDVHNQVRVRRDRESIEPRSRTS